MYKGYTWLTYTYVLGLGGVTLEVKGDNIGLRGCISIYVYTYIYIYIEINVKCTG